MGNNLTRAERWAKTVAETKPPQLSIGVGFESLKFEVTEVGLLRICTREQTYVLATDDTDSLVNWLNGYFA